MSTFLNDFLFLLDLEHSSILWTQSESGPWKDRDKWIIAPGDYEGMQGPE